MIRFRIFQIFAILTALFLPLRAEEVDSTRFSAAFMALGCDAAGLNRAGERLIRELNTQTHLDPMPGQAWKRIDETLKGAPPFVCIVIGGEAELSPDLILNLQRYMSAGGTVLSMANGSQGSSARLLALSKALFPEKNPQVVDSGHILGRTFFMVSDSYMSHLRYERSGTRVCWLETEVPLLANLEASGQGRTMDSETSLKVLINVIFYTMTGNYKDDLTHVRYLFRRRKP
ncbi:MAG: DUF4159 domain-containing protein [Planctomycetes bacterium]|nr:DUF4159 domain-containing protein [Planctomycetota bacterium]